MGSNFMSSEPRTRVLLAGYGQCLLVASDDGRWQVPLARCASLR